VEQVSFPSRGRLSRGRCTLPFHILCHRGVERFVVQWVVVNYLSLIFASQQVRCYVVPRIMVSCRGAEPQSACTKEGSGAPRIRLHEHRPTHSRSMGQFVFYNRKDDHTSWSSRHEDRRGENLQSLDSGRCRLLSGTRPLGAAHVR